MAAEMFLAMTPAEISRCPSLPSQIAWTGCRFSPSGDGLTGLPERLPAGSVLVLEDSIPPGKRDPAQISALLTRWTGQQNCRGILLDFQQPYNRETAALTAVLCETLPCPVAVSEIYAAETDGPVFLSPVPHHVPIREHIAPWGQRSIWLELALDAEVITLTQSGASFQPLPHFVPPSEGYLEEMLHCHYCIQTSVDAVCFTLWRTREDLEALLKDVSDPVISAAVGLYRELSYCQSSR